MDATLLYKERSYFSTRTLISGFCGYSVVAAILDFSTPLWAIPTLLFLAASAAWMRRQAGRQHFPMTFSKVHIQTGIEMLLMIPVYVLLYHYVLHDARAGLVSAKLRASVLAASGWDVSLLAGLRLYVTTVLAFALWYLRGLALNGIAVSAAYTSLPQASHTVAAPLELVRTELAKRLEQLVQKDAPQLVRLGVTMPMVAATIPGGYELRWRFNTVAARLCLAAQGGATRIDIDCHLREPYRFEVFMNPQECMLVQRFLQEQVFAPLRADVARAAAQEQQDLVRRQATETHLRVLQAQIEPHFLFNTLANLRQLYRSSTAAGEDMLTHLIEYLRGSLDDLRLQSTTVGREMDLMQHYLAIMKIRMGERLSFCFIVPESLRSHTLPAAMLVSLVENAIKHGLHDKMDGQLTIRAERADASLRLTVADNGAGFSSVQGSGVGLSNIRARLEAQYPQGAWLEVGAQAHQGFSATIVLPFVETL